ncbi:hypothetical protein C8R44DRAFT_751133 [Mycena epipterygia]|nr:hypothetical protein C8R44DRAFT_751133 [Mycena epipterygia]
MALSSLRITIASMLATMDINKVVDKDRKVIEPSYKYFSAMISSVRRSTFKSCIVMEISGPVYAIGVKTQCQTGSITLPPEVELASPWVNAPYSSGFWQGNFSILGRPGAPYIGLFGPAIAPAKSLWLQHCLIIALGPARLPNLRACPGWITPASHDSAPPRPSIGVRINYRRQLLRAPFPINFTLCTNCCPLLHHWSSLAAAPISTLCTIHCAIRINCCTLRFNCALRINPAHYVIFAFRNALARVAGSPNGQPHLDQGQPLPRLTPIADAETVKHAWVSARKALKVFTDICYRSYLDDAARSESTQIYAPDGTLQGLLLIPETSDTDRTPFYAPDGTLHGAAWRRLTVADMVDMFIPAPE